MPAPLRIDPAVIEPGLRNYAQTHAADIPLALLYALSLAGFTLFGTVPTWLGLDSRAITVPYRALVLSLALWIIVRAMSSGRAVIRTNFWIWVSAAWFFILVRMLFDFSFQPMPLDLEPIEYIVIAVGVCILPMMAFFSRPSDQTLDLAWRLATIGCVIGLGGAVGVIATQGIVGFFTERLSTNVLNPISLGHVGTSLCLLSLAMPETLRRRQTLRHGVGYVLRLSLFCFGVVVVLASGSRGPMLALLLASIAYFAIRPGGKSLGAPVIKAFGIAAALAAITAVAALLFEAYVSLPSLDRLTDLYDVSSRARLRLITGAIGQFMDSPILGDALFVRSERDYPHNPVIEGLMALGLVGVVPVVGVIVIAVKSALHVLRFRPQAAWMALISMQYILGAMFSASLYTSDSFWIFAVAIVAVASAQSHDGMLIAKRRQAEELLS